MFDFVVTISLLNYSCTLVVHIAINIITIIQDKKIFDWKEKIRKFIYLFRRGLKDPLFIDGHVPVQVAKTSDNCEPDLPE